MDVGSTFNIQNTAQLKSAIPCYSFLKYCQSTHGIQLSDLLQSTGLTESDINHTLAVITNQQLSVIRRNSLKYFSPFTLGVLWGSACSLKSLCIFGVYIGSAATIGEVIRCANRLERILGCHLYHSQSYVRGDIACIDLISRQSITNENRRIAEGMFAGGWLRLLSDIGTKGLSSPVSESLLELSLKTPLNNEIEQLSDLENKPEFRICLSAADLEQANRGADAVAFELAARESLGFMEKIQPNDGHGDIASIVSLLIKTHLARGNEKMSYFLQQENIAVLLGVSSSTLNRRLKLAGVTFQEVLDDVREELSCQYLQQGNMPVKHVASKLGYRDVANFRRAFKRWTGLSPSEYLGKSAAVSLC